MTEQLKPFEREQRYIVFKLSDMRKHLEPSDLFNLQQIGRTVAAGREQDGKTPLQCVVVESDWPEYEPTWQAIEARMSGAQPAQAGEVDERVAFEAWARPNGYDLRRNDVLGHYSSIDTSRAWSGFRAGRASLPAAQQATPEPVGEPFKVEQCMQMASDEFDAFLIGGRKGEPPRMSMAFASTLFKTIIRERGMFFTDTHPAPGVPEGFALVQSPITEAMHEAACKVLTRATGLDGLPQRMLDALAAAQAKGGE